MTKTAESTDGSLSARAKFRLGRLVATPAALRKIPREDIQATLSRHLRGDWGELEPEDREVNEEALLHQGRLLSVYHDDAGTKFYIITEADRSVTTVLLPEDY